MAHADPTRKLLIARIADAEAGTRRIRRGVGRRWGSMEHVLGALVGHDLRVDLRKLILCIYRVQDEYGCTEGLQWRMPSVPTTTLQAFAERKFITILDDNGTITVEGDVLADAYEATLHAMARKEIPDNFNAPALLN